MCTLREMLDRLTTPSYPSYSTGLFTDVWNPKKSPVRQSTLAPSLFGLNYGTHSPYLGFTDVTPTLTLAGQTLTFVAGHWVDNSATPRTTPTATFRGQCEERPGADSRVRSLKKKARDLEEENNALKLRVELLLDMWTESVAEVYVLKYTLQDAEEALAKRQKKKSQELSQ